MWLWEANLGLRRQEFLGGRCSLPPYLRGALDDHQSWLKSPGPACQEGVRQDWALSQDSDS